LPALICAIAELLPFNKSPLEAGFLLACIAG